MCGMNMAKFFSMSQKFQPKNAFNDIYRFNKETRHLSEYEKIVKGFEQLHHIKQRHFILELYDNNTKSLESYCFSLYKDDNGYYTIYNNRIKHFHNKNNAIKYQCAKHMINNNLSSEKLTYMCLENSRIRSNESFNEFINRSYERKHRIFIK